MHPSRSRYFSWGWGLPTLRLLMQSPSKPRKSTETNRRLAKGDFGTYGVLWLSSYHHCWQRHLPAQDFPRAGPRNVEILYGKLGVPQGPVSKDSSLEFLPGPLAWILACTHFLRYSWIYYGLTRHSTYSDTGLQTLDLKLCESKLRELTLTVSPHTCCPHRSCLMNFANSSHRKNMSRCYDAVMYRLYLTAQDL